MKTDMYLRYLSQFLEGEMFQTEVLEKIKNYILCPKYFFPKTCADYEIM